jgi:iron complex outermembrane receptor protein
MTIGLSTEEFVSPQGGRRQLTPGGNMKNNSILVAAWLAVAAQSFVSLAYAQAAGGNRPATDDGSSVQEVVVTGSRVIANGNNSPTPVTVVQTDELMKLQPTNITDALNNLPVFQGSRGQFSNPNTTGLYGGGNPASNQLNLRNLSPQRTLVLLDGQRVPPGNAIGVVDVDLIPQMLIQRVDIVTGGVSAVYGSDAVAGVVNYVIDKNFNGFKGESSYGLSSRGDDQTWKVGVAAGAPWGERGHIEASFQHYDDKGLPRRNMRDYFRNSLLGATPGSTATQGSAANPYQSFSNVNNNNNSFGGLIPNVAANGALRGLNFTTDGVLSPFARGAATGTPTSEIGGDGSYGGLNSLKAPLSFDQLFLRVDFELSERLRLHAQGGDTRKQNYTYSGATTLNNFTYSAQNAYLAEAYRTLLGTTQTFTMSKSWIQAPQVRQVSELNAYFGNVGFEGQAGKFNWGADLNHGSTTIDDVFEDNVNNQRLAAALDAVVNPANGQTVCNASLTNPAYADCVPLNLFGPTASSAAAIDYVTGTTHFKPKFDLTEVSAHIAGDVFSTWAGAVTAALSAEWRKLTFSDTSDATPDQFANCTGLRFNCSANTGLWVNAFANSEEVSQSVKEGAIEFNVPLLKDKPFAQSFNLNGAARFTSYDFGGDAWTWKAGLDWHISDAVTLRGTVSRDIEAPSLSQLFQPLLVTQVNNQDRLTLANPTIKITNIGNPDLVSEIGKTTTAGIVWRPGFAPGFAVSLDAYRVKIDGALTQLQGYNPQLQDICYASAGASFYCTLQTRPIDFVNRTAANTVTSWTAVFANVSGIETYGADLEMNYGGRLFDRAFSARLFTTWQPHYLIAQPGAPVYDQGNVAFPNVVPLQAIPALRLTASVNFGVTENLSVGITERYRDGLKMSAVPTDVYVDPDVGSLAYTDLNVSYRFWQTGTEAYLHARNLFDRMPPGVAGLSAGSGYPQIDDPLGRFYTVGVRVKF